MKKEQTPFDKWCNFNPDKIYKDPKHKKILNFYLWSCPVEKTAYGSKTFKDLGWSGGNQFKKLKKLLLISSNEKIPFVSVKKNDLIETLNRYNQMTSCSLSEVIIIVITNNQEMRALFRAIRNSLAHGSFKLRKENKTDDYYYFFENRKPENNEIRARIVLKSSTLCSWIKTVQSGYSST